MTIQDMTHDERTHFWAARKFNDDPSEKWFCRKRWQDMVIQCHVCDAYAEPAATDFELHPYRCPDCERRFGVRAGTFLAKSPLSLETWRGIFAVMTGELHVEWERYQHPVVAYVRELGLNHASARQALDLVRDTIRSGGWLPVLETDIVPGALEPVQEVAYA